MTHNVTNKNMAELPFINNNTFAGYLHSMDVVQQFHLGLPKGSTYRSEERRVGKECVP